MKNRFSLATLALFAALAGPVLAQEDDAALWSRLQAQAKAYSPSFAESGPFDSAEWTTNDGYPLLGDPNAKKGGRLLGSMEEPLPTFRTDGPESNLTVLSRMHDLVYERLLGLHPTTLEFIPGLATHWQFDYDAQMLRFRLNPKARWSDGSEVTSDDVVASWEHSAGVHHKGDGTEDASWSRKDPYSEQLYGLSYERPVAEDKYTVAVKMKEVNWRLPIYFGVSMKIFPAKYIRVSGEDYLKGYQWRFVMGSGPYQMLPEDHEEQQSYALSRRIDYWGKDERFSIGLYNFDKIKYVVVGDDTIEFEKFKKGEVDYYFNTKAQRWAEEYDFDKVQNGWIQRRKVYTKEPQGFGGLVFNMRVPPFDDLRVRKAFCYLFNRERLMEKLFYRQYDFVDSYEPGTVYANENNQKIRYNPELATELLADAGWKTRNKDGWLVNDEGKIFEVTLELGSPTLERIFTVVQDDFQKAGIKLDLALVDYTTLLKKIEDREFKIHYQSWGGIIFPNPESAWSSDLADKKANNNIPGFKNDLVDQLCGLYDKTPDLAKRVQILRKIDGLIFSEHPYALGWYGPFARVAYWNKFGMPSTYFSATGRPDADILSMWWYEEDKDRALQSGMKSGAKLPVPETIDVKPFEDIQVGGGWDKGEEDEEDGGEDDEDEGGDQ